MSTGSQKGGVVGWKHVIFTRGVLRDELVLWMKGRLLSWFAEALAHDERT